MRLLEHAKFTKVPRSLLPKRLDFQQLGVPLFFWGTVDSFSGAPYLCRYIIR